MNLVRSLIILLLSATACMAQDIAVRSGEHEQFTRLVIYTQSPGAWEFGRVEQGYELRLAADDARYDLSRAFDLIPRSRVKGLKDKGRGHLLIQVNCDCHANVFVADGGQIVVDILSGRAPDDTDAYNAFLDASPSSALSKHAGMVSSLKERLGLPLFSEPASSEQHPHASEARTAAVRDHSGDPQVGPEEELAPPSLEGGTKATTGRVKETELALIEQIGRAAAQGLVSANLSTLEAEIQRVTDPVEKRPKPIPDGEQLPVQEPIASIDANDHVAIQTSIDRESNDRKAEVLSTREGFACFRDEDYAIETWGGGIEGGVDLGKYFPSLLGEFDRPNAAALNAYIRHLIYLTFGAEAMLTAYHFDSVVHRPDIVRQMSQIMDNQQANDFSVFAPQMGCDGKTALWAAMSQPRFRSGYEINKKAIILAFSELPLHLRRHLGPSLAQKFLDYGDNETAIALRNHLGRAGGDHGAGFELLEARIDIERGEHASAETSLAALVNDDSNLSPDAAIEFVNLRLSQAEVVPMRIIEIIATYAYEQRNLPLGAELRSVEIRALAAASEFKRAYGRIEQAEKDGQLSSTELQPLRTETLLKLVQNGSDAQFLRYALGGGLDLRVADSELRELLSRRLLKLGFPDNARAVLDVEGHVPGASQRMIFAQIALRQLKPKVALGYLAGLEGAEAERVRAEAFMMDTDFDGAAEIYRGLGDTDRQLEAELRAGDWQNLSRNGADAIRDLGRSIVESETEGSNETLPPLAENLGLLEKSSQTRLVIEKLLSEVPVP